MEIEEERGSDEEGQFTHSKVESQKKKKIEGHTMNAKWYLEVFIRVVRVQSGLQ